MATGKSPSGTIDFLLKRAEQNKLNWRRISSAAKQHKMKPQDFYKLLLERAKMSNIVSLAQLQKLIKEKEAVGRKMSEAGKKRWEEMSPGEREAVGRKMSEGWKRMSPEEKEAVGRKISEAGKKRWEENEPRGEGSGWNQKFSCKNKN